MKNINYFYFGLYFLFLTLMAAGGIFTKTPLSESKFFFFCYALGQISLEVLFLICVVALLKRWAHPLITSFFIGATFLLFVLHVFDAIMDRILDLSIWDAISLFVVNETLGNFLYLLDATGLPLWAWGAFFLLFALLPLVGIFFYRITAKICAKRPLSLRKEHCCMAFLCLPLALVFWDFSGSRLIHPNTYTAFIQSLPWKSTFLQPKSIQINMPVSLQGFPQENEIESAIATFDAPLNTPKPNIYLFVIESLRSDILTEETAPNLALFQKECTPVSASFANGNASHLSWFSIFHSQFSHFWHAAQEVNWKMGSPPLTLLKHLGYKIHLYSSAQLGYYKMDELLFGEHLKILDTVHNFPHPFPLSAADTDAEAVDALVQDVKDNPSLQTGQVFIVFLDSTHFDYTWPKHFAPKFTPFASEFAYLTALYSKKTRALIKNRYKNAVHYIDHLFGQFKANIPNFNEAMIVVTGDHGEEFCEHGHLFHGSHLISEQIKIPLLIKLKEANAKRQGIISQIDIFPSIFDAIFGKIPTFLQGQSVLREMQWPFVISSRFNAGRSPYELCLQNEHYKLIVRLNHPHNIAQSNGLQIMTFQNPQDQNLPTSSLNVHSFITQEFSAAWQRLFPIALQDPLEDVK
jgi:glucan phosphoethanolaminetransferase (alkaline phosphatase superfamily)